MSIREKLEIEDEKDEKIANYMALGMSFGAMAGCAATSIFMMFGKDGWSILGAGVGLLGGMLIGLIIGMAIQKKNK